MYVEFNPNPAAARVGDCAIRAIAKACGVSWEKSYIDLCIYGLMNCDLPSANLVWGRYLHDHDFVKEIVPYECPHCTVESFADNHKEGVYVMALNGHVVTIVDGDYYDTWDSGQEIPLYYWRKK